MPEDVARRDIDKVRVRLFYLVDVRLDVLHVRKIFHRALFAGGNDQPLFANTERHLGLLRLEVDRLGKLNHLARSWRNLDLDERFDFGLEGPFAAASTAGRA